MLLHREKRWKIFVKFSYYNIIFSERSFYALVTYWPYKSIGKFPATNVFKIGFINFTLFGCPSSSFSYAFVFSIFICCVQ